LNKCNLYYIVTIALLTHNCQNMQWQPLTK